MRKPPRPLSGAPPSKIQVGAVYCAPIVCVLTRPSCCRAAQRRFAGQSEACDADADAVRAAAAPRVAVSGIARSAVC